MFNMLPITGDSLPIGTFVLTYDDGPGPNTQPIAEYLSSMGIAATFFVVGEFAERQPRVLTRLRALGHRLSPRSMFMENLRQIAAHCDRAAAAGSDEAVFAPAFAGAAAAGLRA